MRALNTLFSYPMPNDILVDDWNNAKAEFSKLSAALDEARYVIGLHQKHSDEIGGRDDNWLKKYPKEKIT